MNNEEKVKTNISLSKKMKSWAKQRPESIGWLVEQGLKDLQKKLEKKED